ncbi:slipin family protein [Xanthomonas vesicatoria]|uniref:Membrane protease subunit, stomatin/prohibitin n=1 Tax=Xanthomonas vesicatoria ATCC 35937 TaxID=925775 RepID=F0B9D8_9XANT|nr:slipin family protein [Xanthomonas vesicatoria]APP75614.1 stomatin/prohibitin-family membrane protease subunit [Xanthomonas vesicatoria ATCC 35937]EGD10899.1 membrane protease subunit, stomatin/prohibitin [Xanthomonas vesicatoria ATCC 35937]KTF30270.1 stomatin/prohibitin-family membrane protease subunit [Xanthomonas vesicatoria]KTF34172.1 stomatin/prohibitin-family membrane protease subunit [Xanthomonas vesicatoria]MCC8559511.1 slipin family protein [Xanthomonas vesicatoria]
MFWTKRVVIGDGERGLVYRNRRFERVLVPGVYRLFDPLSRTEVSVHTIHRDDEVGHDADMLIDTLGAALPQHFVLADIGTAQVGLLIRNGKLDQVLPPGTRALYWRDAAIEVQTLPLGDGLQVPGDVQRRLRQLGTLSRVAACMDVPAESQGLVLVDGRLMAPFGPGAYAFWNFQKNVSTEVIDLRVQSVEVSGQELLTRDKVSLRVNLAASMRVTDAVAMRTRVAKAGDYLYRELQYGLRRAVASKTLDELLADKASLDADIFGYVRGSVGGFGIDVLGVGVKDVILPGEMRAILNAVVQAEKQAQANVIRRREEANATRSLLNTAKLIEDSPVLMRLKELEALEKVTEKIDRLTVFGGLDGVLKQLVTLR